ncbi:MAG: DUF2127 domain-containing protein [Candidatus Woesearchaeota archaeon]|nr:DUF2127 domain-containing protein [Candidatus Woesearchaeota archaeon]
MNIIKRIIGKGKFLYKIFEWGVLIKAVYGFFEILGGILLSISGQKVIDNILILITRQEIIEDPNDFVANYLIGLSNDFSIGTQVFAVLFLIFHGVVNILLAVSLLKKRVKAFPVAMSIFCVFIVYQLYRYFHTYSLLLLFLTFFDILIVFIVWLEYKKLTLKNKD